MTGSFNIQDYLNLPELYQNLVILQQGKEPSYNLSIVFVPESLN